METGEKVGRPSTRSDDAARPFLKWVGGKGQLMAQLQPLLPPGTVRRYFEPFVGSAALFFALRPEKATLSDVNAELVDCYRAVQTDVDGVIEALSAHRYEEQAYYRVREQEPGDLSPCERAARTIYLNKTGYNGLYRVNRAGRFNVPFGRYTNPGFASRESVENLRACSRALATVRLLLRDFGEVVRDAREGDLVYFDPPYVPLSDTSDFTAYVPGGFGPRDQERLASVVHALSDRGVRVMLSNSDTPVVRDLYARYRIDVVSAARSINSRANKRGKVAEVVVRNYG
ncbi:MAG TPA: DNA adenine methylase [Polyangiaceae bacterium]